MSVRSASLVQRRRGRRRQGLQDEDLRAAHARAALGVSRAETQVAHDPSQCVHDGAYAGRLLAGRRVREWLGPNSSKYGIPFIGRRNTSPRFRHGRAVARRVSAVSAALAQARASAGRAVLGSRHMSEDRLIVPFERAVDAQVEVVGSKS